MNEQDIFIKALDFKDATERDSFLDSVCGDSASRERVERLMELHQHAGLAIDSPAAVALSEFDPALVGSIGEQIGPYHLLEQIGEGGMGVVYLAEQKSPVKRQVALKVIKPGMDTRQVIARFDSERQALSMMQHTNIARVLDVGATETGRPYFVMELVRGVPITEFCRGEGLGINDRLKLFVQVCSAIQHSHQKGIIHRDVKPSNVMVTLHDGEPMVKIIDFGIAKALNSQLTERTLFTNFSQMIGTPLYMSPEQAEMSGLDIDTRSDIYSLGVLLYELLTGSTPFDEERLRAAGYDEMRRIIKEEEPPRPSVRVSTIGDKLNTVTDPRTLDSRKFSELLRGELDWIAVKAMEKNRQRRYQTAQELSEDVKRFLSNEPVSACPPSKTYRLRKAIARHRAITALAALAAFLLVCGTVVSTAFAIKASNAETLASDALAAAELKAKISDGLSQFLRDDLLQASLWEGADRSVTLRAALDKAAVNFEGRYADQPLVETEIRFTLGMAYHALSEQSTATRHLKRVYDLCVTNQGENDRQTLSTLFQLAIVRNSFDKARLATVRERAAEAAPSFAAVLARQQDALGSDDPDALTTMGHLALCYSRCERFSQANSLFAQANALFASTLPAHDQRGIDCLEQTAASLKSQGKGEEFDALQEKITDLRKKRLIAMNREHEEKIVELEAQVIDRARLLGEQDSQTIEANIALAQALIKSRRTDEAKSILGKLCEVHPDGPDADDGQTIAAKLMLGKLHFDLNELDKARSFLEPLLELEDVETQTMQILEYTAEKLKFQNRFIDAAEVHGRVADAQLRVYGPTDPRPLRSLREEGVTYVYAKKLDEVQRVADEIIALVGENHSDVIFCQLAIASESLTAGDLEAAEKLLEPLFTRSTKSLGDTDPLTLVAGSKLTVLYQQQGQTAKAEQQARQMLLVVDKEFGEQHVHTMIAVCHLASICIDSGKLEEASQLCSRAAAIQPLLVSNAHQRSSNLSTLADTFLKARNAGAQFQDDTEYHDVVKRLIEAAVVEGNQKLADGWAKKITVAAP